MYFKLENNKFYKFVYMVGVLSCKIDPLIITDSNCLFEILLFSKEPWIAVLFDCTFFLKIIFEEILF